MLHRFQALLLMFVFPLSGYAQGFVVTSVKGHDTSIVFPFFADKDKDIIAGRINTLLFLSELELLPSESHLRYIDEQVGKDNEGLYGNKVDISYEIHRNDAKVLSLQLNQAASGMTMHYWSTYYTFNAANGSRIDLEDVFNSKGYEYFRKMVERDGFASINGQLKVWAGVKDTTWVDDVKKLFGEKNGLYFYISNDTLFVDQSSLLSKATILSGLWMKLYYPASKLLPLLNDYGRAIFTHHGADMNTFVSRGWPQLMYGTINKKAVIMLLRNDYDKRYMGVYAYEHIGLGIDLDGVLSGKLAQLKEYDRSHNQRATLTGILKDDELAGFWEDSEKLHKYIFRIRTRW